MPSWTLHLVNARGQLASCADVILSACAEAEARVGAVTAPLALDIVIRGVGARELVLEAPADEGLELAAEDQALLDDDDGDADLDDEQPAPLA